MLFRFPMKNPRPYANWRKDPEKRWRDAFHTFGHLMMTHARNDALREIPESASAESRTIAEKAVKDALYNVMMILEGVVGVKADANHYLEFVLIARIRDDSTPREVVEEFELAPNGVESACMGFHFWTEGDFTA